MTGMSAIKITKGSSHKYTVQGKRGKDALSHDEQDLYELCCLSGVDMSPAVFRIVLDLLRMNVSPVAIVQMLKSMVHRSAKSQTTSPSDTSVSLQMPSSADAPRSTTTSSKDGKEKEARRLAKTARFKPTKASSHRT